ncbi:MAG: hypothetical protein IID08_05610 [Candidatus Hydrogenedentes bacterium]|nr:hypothetical protein [Candidatus Hydrogenedentota bacterium]
MTDQDIHRDDETEAEIHPDEEMSGSEAALEKRLAEPVLQGGVEGLDKAQVGISAFLILLAGAAVFANSFAIPFIYKDYGRIVENAAVHHLSTAPEAWAEGAMTPLAAITYALNWSSGSGDLFPFRLFNVILHLFNAVLVFLLCRRLLGRKHPEIVAMAGGMLFVAHPAVTQSVNYLSERSVLLMTFFALASILLFLRATDRDTRVGTGSLALALVCFALAWISDSAVWILPFLLPVVEYASRRKLSLRSVSVYGIFLLTLIALFVAARSAGDRVPIEVASAFGQGGTLTSYLGTLLYPVDLRIERAPFDVTSPVYIGVGILFAGLVALRFAPVLGAALLWVFLTLAAPGLFGADEAPSDAAVYLPLAGLAVVVPWLLTRVPQGGIRTIVGAGVAALIVVFGALTFMRNQAWTDETDLLIEAYSDCPQCYGPAMRLGELNMELGQAAMDFYAYYAGLGNPEEAGIQEASASDRFAFAETLFENATLHPDADASAWFQLGLARRYLGRREEALDTLYRALRMDPTRQEIAGQLGILIEDRAAESGDPKDIRLALDYYRSAASHGRLPDEVAVKFASLLANTGNFIESKAILNTLDPVENAEFLSHFQPVVQGMLEGLSGMENRFTQLMISNPGDPRIVHVRAELLFLQGNYLRSSYLIESAFRQKIRNVDLWLVLGLDKAKMGIFDRFLLEHGDAPPAVGGDSAWIRLGRRCVTVNEWESALLALRKEEALQEGDFSAPLFLGDLAVDARNAERAMTYYGLAANENPNASIAIVKMFDIAAASNQPELAERLLADAERRGVAPEEIETMRSKLRGQAVEATEPGRIGLF